MPTPPYTTSAMVEYLLRTTLSGAAIGASSVPDKPMVDQIINWVCAQIDLQFQSAGYVLPLDVVSGETWPTHQTTYLQLVATLGATAMAGGHALRPAPALGPGRQGGTGNSMQDLYNTELKKIYDPQTGRTTLNYRANYYTGTPAQVALTLPKGPTTDFMEGKFDLEREWDNHSVADRIMLVQSYMQSTYQSLQWDYMYGLFSINKGLGTVSGELSN